MEEYWLFYLTIDFNVISGGIFVVLLCGLAIAVVIAICEFCYNSKRNAQIERVC